MSELHAALEKALAEQTGANVTVSDLVMLAAARRRKPGVLT
jgi:hypothetical protein